MCTNNIDKSNAMFLKKTTGLFKHLFCLCIAFQIFSVSWSLHDGASLDEEAHIVCVVTSGNPEADDSTFGVPEEEATVPLSFGISPVHNAVLNLVKSVVCKESLFE